MFAQILWRKRGFTLLVDEASQLQGPSFIEPQLDRFVRMAPGGGVPIIQTMHRPRDSNGLCRSLASDWYIFRTMLGRDVQVIAEHCGEELAQRVSEFQEGGYQCLHWNDATGSGDIVCDSSAWYENLGRG